MAAANPDDIPYNIPINGFGDIIPPGTDDDTFSSILEKCIANILNGIPIREQLKNPIVRGFNQCLTTFDKRRFLFWLFLEAAIRGRLELVKLFTEKSETRKLIDEFMHIPIRKILTHQTYLRSTPVSWDSVLLFVLDNMIVKRTPNPNILYLVMNLYDDQLPTNVLERYGHQEFFKEPFKTWQSEREHLLWMKEPCEL